MKKFSFLFGIVASVRAVRPKKYDNITWYISQRLKCDKASMKVSSLKTSSTFTTNVFSQQRPACNKYFSHEYSSGHLSNNSELSDAVYEEVSEETLEALTEKFEDLGEESYTSDSFDVNYASGVITIKLGNSHGTYVINKQTPNKQIWFSSPVSGPKRYDFVNGAWVYKYDSVTLHQRLTEELSEMYNKRIDFTDCMFGKPKSS